MDNIELYNKPPQTPENNFDLVDDLDTFKEKVLFYSKNMSKKDALKQALRDTFPSIDICQE